MNRRNFITVLTAGLGALGLPVRVAAKTTDTFHGLPLFTWEGKTEAGFRSVVIANDVLQQLATTGDWGRLARHLRATNPDDVSVYRFAHDSFFITAIGASRDGGGYNPDPFKAGGNIEWANAWQMVLVSEKFTAKLPHEGGAFPYPDHYIANSYTVNVLKDVYPNQVFSLLK